MRMKKIVALALAVMMLMTVAACGSAPAASSAPSSGAATPATPESVTTPAASTGMYPGTPGSKEVTVNLASEPPKLSTILSTDTTSGIVFVHTVEGLTKLDQNSNPIPAMAESWTTSADGLTWTFKIRQGQKWSNGEPVTAKDFTFAWTQVLTPVVASEYNYFAFIFKNGQAFYDGKAKIEDVGFKAVDDYTLEVVLENPLPYFLGQLAYKTLAPVNEKAYTEFGDKFATEAEYFVTNGGYKMTSWTHEDRLVLEKNADYYDAANVDINKITMLMISDSNTGMNAFKAGEADMIGLSGDQPAMLKAEGQAITSYSDGSTWYFEYNHKTPLLANAKIRKAMTMAVDVDSFVLNVLKNNSVPANIFTPDCINGFDGKPFSTAVPTKLTRDAAAAKVLFEEGLKELGKTAADLDGLKYICDDGDLSARIGAYMQEQWKTNLGFTVEVQQMPFKTRLDRMANKDFDIVMAGWGPDYNDPMTFLDLWLGNGGNNHTSWANARYDELIALATKEADAAKRQEMFIECEKIINEEMPVGLIYARMRDFVTSDKLTGVMRNPFTDLSLMYAKSN